MLRKVPCGLVAKAKSETAPQKASTFGSQDYLLTAIIIYWNTKQLAGAVAQRKKASLDTPAHLLGHISPLGWAHIVLTSEYRWRRMNA